MSGGVEVIAQAGTVTVLVPLRSRKRRGRKIVIADKPAGHLTPASPQNAVHKTIPKALGRAYRWKRMLESGEFNSITDLAKAEKINHAYVRRILRLTLLSPEITEAILNGIVEDDDLEHLLASTPIGWAEQVAMLR